MEEPPSSPAAEASESPESDNDEAIVEEVPSVANKKGNEVIPPKMKSIVVDEWIQLNSQPPLWIRCASCPFVQLILILKQPLVVIPRSLLTVSNSGRFAS